MSRQEFDNYLALLTRLLRIAPQQREQMAEEFRSHMEDRLDDLLACGIGRDEAIQKALEEFGDAAALAAQLASISWNRKKRWYMKVSAFSVAGLAAALLLAIALWPESRRIAAPAQAIAQQPAAKAKGRPKAPPRRGTLEVKLTQRIVADFDETPMTDVLEFLSDSADIQFYINRRALSEESLDLDSPITMSLSDVQVETILDLALEQVSEQLAYLERDGVLIISTITALEGATEVRVYNCRDLLALTMPQPGMSGMEGMMGGMMGMGIPGGMTPGMGVPGMGGGMRAGAVGPGDASPMADPFRPADAEAEPASGSPFRAKREPRNGSGEETKTPPPATRSSMDVAHERAILAQRTRGSGGAAPMAGMGGMGGGMEGMGGGMMMGGMPGMSSRPAPTTDHERRAARLMDLITTAVDPHSWQNTGGFGTISEYEGMIVVSHNPRTHKKIENVLSMLRQSAGLPQMDDTGNMSGVFPPRAGAYPVGGGDPFGSDGGSASGPEGIPSPGAASP